MPKVIKFILVFTVLIVNSGCGLLSSTQPVVPQRQVLKTFEALQSHRVVHPELLEEGQSFTVLPFSVGAGVEAGDHSDRVALKIIRSFSDTFKASGSEKSLTFGEKSGNVDLIVDGRIMRMETASRLKQWVSRNNKSVIAIEGKVIDRRTGKIVLFFVDEEEVDASEDAYDIIAIRIGADIANYIQHVEQLNSGVK